MTESVVEGFSDLEEIGSGGFATVYRARQAGLNREVALKILRAKDLDEATTRRFERECHAMGELSWHPNVVGVYESGIAETGHPWLAMEFMARGSVADRVRREGPLPWAEAVEVGVYVAGALGAVHAGDRLHRDIKPENLLVGPFDEVKLGDFGIAVDIDGGGATAAQFTPGFVATEVLQGQPPDERSDVYSLGATLHALMAGHSPFATVAGEPVSALLMRAMQGERPRLEGVPDDVADLVVSCLSIDPAARPQTAVALGEALQAIQRAHDLPVTPLRVAAQTDGSQPRRTVAPDSSPTVIGGQAPPVPPAADSSATIVGAAAATGAAADAGEDSSSTIVAGAPTAPTATPPAADSPSPDPSPASPAPSSPAPSSPAAGQPASRPPAPDPEPSGTKRRGMLIGAGITVVVILVLLVVAGALMGGDESTDGDGSTDATESTDDSTAGADLIEAQPADVLATIPLPGEPGIVALSPDGADVWVTDASDDTVSRVETATNTVVATTAVGVDPSAIVVLDEFVWVANAGDNTVSQIDVATSEVVATIPVGGPPTGVDAEIGAQEDTLWAATSTPGALDEITITDPSAPTPSRSASLGTATGAVVYGGDGWWVSEPEANTVAFVDLDDFSTVEVAVGDQPGSLGVVGSRLYVANVADNTVSVVDQTARAVTATVDVGAAPSAIAATSDDVWVVTGSDTITRIDGSRLAERLQVGTDLDGVATTGDGTELWVSDPGEDVLLRLRVGG